MFLTEEISLVDFYKSCKKLARNAGFSVLLCFIAREADTPASYADIINKWQSLDSLTGPRILFLFAGRSFREHYESDTIYNLKKSCISFSPDMLMLHSQKLFPKPHDGFSDGEHEAFHPYSLSKLRENTSNYHHQRNSKNYFFPYAKHCENLLEEKNIPKRQTSHIIDLKEYLCLLEKDIPCLHITFLNDDFSMNIKVDNSRDIYKLVKSIVETTEDERMIAEKNELNDILFNIRRLKFKIDKLNRLIAIAENNPQEQLKSIENDINDLNETDIDQKDALQKLIASLSAFIQQSDGNNRKTCFFYFNSSRKVIGESLAKRRILSSVQRLISIVDNRHHSTLDSSQTASCKDSLQKELILIKSEIANLKLKRNEKISIINSLPNPSGEYMKKKILEALEKPAYDAIVVATRQELTAVRAYLDKIEASREPYDKSDNWPMELITIAAEEQFKFLLILANEQGVEGMSNLLRYPCIKESKNVILVGMMAGIKGKSKILDVQAPKYIVDATRLGTRDGAIIPEPQGRTVSSTLHNQLLFLDLTRHGLQDITLIAHKQSACVAAKFDDLTPELAEAALSCNRENIIGLEMEGSALTAMQSYQDFTDQRTCYLMIKGVADYAGNNLSEEDILMLRSGLEFCEGNNIDFTIDNPDPTNNKILKSLLQKVATIRSTRVAIALLKELTK